MGETWTCGCGCWGFLVGLVAWAIAILFGVVMVKALAIGVIALFVCALVGLGFDILSVISS